MRTHTGATPYQCNLCPKKFSDSNGLKRHQLNHKRKNETVTSVQQISEAPIIEASHTQPINIEQPIFENATVFNVNPETIQFMAPPEIVGDNSQLIFKIQ